MALWMSSGHGFPLARAFPLCSHQWLTVLYSHQRESSKFVGSVCKISDRTIPALLVLQTTGGREMRRYPATASLCIILLGANHI